MAGTRKLGISEEAELSAERMAQAVYEGKIKQHLLRNTYQVQQGTLEEKEFAEYSDFVKTKFPFVNIAMKNSNCSSLARTFGKRSISMT